MADKGEPASTPSRGFYRKGPLRLRGDQVPEATADQRLLDRGSGAAWAHEDPWRVMRIQAEFVEGFGTLAEVGPAVCLFGSARLHADTQVYADARDRKSTRLNSRHVATADAALGLKKKKKV